VLEVLAGALRYDVLSVVVVEVVRGVSSSTTVVQAGRTNTAATALRANNRCFFIGKCLVEISFHSFFDARRRAARVCT
jgi:hypothetical protein